MPLLHLNSTRTHSLTVRVLCALGVETSTTIPRLPGPPILHDKIIETAFLGRILHAIILIEQCAVHGIIFALSQTINDVKSLLSIVLTQRFGQKRDTIRRPFSMSYRRRWQYIKRISLPCAESERPEDDSDK